MDAAGSLGRITVGSIIDDRYEVVSQLGTGGFATVYRARQRHIDRPVAVKVLSVALQLRDDATFERRFVREAQIVAQINHPNVVTVYDFGFTGALRQPYIAMELLEGHDLEAELAREGRLPARRALPLFIGALDALAVGHAAGIVHKDLKPANLHLSRSLDGREVLKVLDFGIARNADSDDVTRFTATGQFMGTPQYAAPEYLDRQEVSPALDVYQMGLILVEMLTGRRVVDADSPMACMMAHSTGRLTVPSALLDTPVGAVVQTALAHDPEQRYASAATMRDALARLDAALIDEALAHADFGLVSAPHAAVTGTGPTLAFDTGAFEAPRARAAAAVTTQATARRTALVPILIAIAIIAALVVAVMVTVLVMGKQGNEQPEAAASAPTPVSPAPMADPATTADALETGAKTARTGLPAPPPTPSAEALAEQTAAADETAPPPVTTVDIQLESSPAGATVELDGKKIGVTPLTVTLEADATADVVLELDGYRSEDFVLDPTTTDDGVVSHKLRKKRRRSRDDRNTSGSGSDDSPDDDSGNTGGGDQSSGGSIPFVP